MLDIYCNIPYIINQLIKSGETMNTNRKSLKISKISKVTGPSFHFCPGDTPEKNDTFIRIWYSLFMLIVLHSVIWLILESVSNRRHVQLQRWIQWRALWNRINVLHAKPMPEWSRLSACWQCIPLRMFWRTQGTYVRRNNLQPHADTVKKQSMIISIND